MKINFNQPAIIAQAQSLGFNFNTAISAEDLNESLREFFYDNQSRLEQIEDYCKVQGTDSNQYVNYNHGEYECSGVLIDWQGCQDYPAGSKVKHSDFVIIDTDGVVKSMNLYDLVPDTPFNVSEGIYWDAENNCHAPVVTNVDKSEYEVFRYSGGYYGISKQGTFGGEVVFGGDSADEDCYNKQMVQDVCEQWDGRLFRNMIDITEVDRAR